MSDESRNCDNYHRADCTGACRPSKPAECENGCPENQTCDYCAGGEEPDCSENPNTFDAFLLLGYTIDNKIVPLEVADDPDFLSGEVDEWIVHVKLPMSAIKGTEPTQRPIPVIDLSNS